MKRNKQCLVDFTLQLSNIKRLVHKGLKDAYGGDFKGDPKALKRYVDDELAALESDITLMTKEGFRDGLDEATVDQISGSAKRKLVDLINTYKATNNNLHAFEQLAEGATDIKHIEGSIKTLFLNQEKMVEAENTRAMAAIDNAIDNIPVILKDQPVDVARKAEKLYREAVREGRWSPLQDYIAERTGIEGIDTNEVMFKALAQGHHDDPIINAIAKQTLVVKDILFNRAQERSPYLNHLQNHIMPVRFLSDKVGAQGLDGFKAHLEQFVNLEKMGINTEAKFDTMAKDLYLDYTTNRALTSGGKGRPQGIYSHRALIFKDTDSEWEMFKAFGDLNRGVLHSVLDHGRRLVTKTAEYNTSGPDMNFVFSNLLNHIRKSDAVKGKTPGKTEANLKQIEGTLIRLKEDIDYRNKDLTVGKETQYLLKRATANVISATLTGASAMRNFVWDNTAHPALIKSLMFGDSFFLGWASEFSKLAYSSIRGKRTGMEAKLLEAQGIAAMVSGRSVTQGLTRDMIDTGIDPKHGLASKAEHLTRKFADAVSYWSIADMSYRASRVNAGVHNMSMIYDIAQRGYDSMSEPLKRMSRQHGLGREEWDILKNVESFEFSKRLKGIDEDGFLKLDDADVKSIQRPFETAKDTKLRLMNTYSAFLLESVDTMAPVVSNRAKLSRTTGWALSDTIAEDVFRFSNISLSAYYSLMRAGSYATGINPNGVGGLAGDLDVWKDIGRNSPKIAARMMTAMIAGSIMMQWAQDARDGKQFRQISPLNTAEGLTQVGAGGLAGSIVNAIYHKGSPVSMPSDVVFQPVARAVKAGNRYLETGDPRGLEKVMIDTAQTMTGFGNMWYTRAVTKNALRAAIGSPQTRPHDRRRDEQLQRETAEWSEENYDFWYKLLNEK